MTAAFLDTQPHLLEEWASHNPTGRIGRPDELRGVVAWLASDAGPFCTGSECVSLYALLAAPGMADEFALWICSILVSGGHHAW